MGIERYVCALISVFSFFFCFTSVFFVFCLDGVTKFILGSII